MSFRSFWAAAICAACLPSSAAFAQSSDASGATSAPLAAFEAKRVRPPAAGTKRRITVQITEDDLARQRGPAPTPVALPADAQPAAQPGPSNPGRYAWFWNKVSPNMASTGPGRLNQALTALSGGDPVQTPRLQTMREIAAARAVPILTSTVGTKVSPALVLAVISVESSGRADAVSSAGAQGLMQLMPATAARFGVSNSLAPAENIAGGVKYLDWLMGEFNADPILVLAGYNAGEGSVRNHKGVPPYAETRDYVPKVLAAFQVARALCQTPPELITDGCVFATSQ